MFRNTRKQLVGADLHGRDDEGVQYGQLIQELGECLALKTLCFLCCVHSAQISQIGDDEAGPQGSQGGGSHWHFV